MRSGRRRRLTQSIRMDVCACPGRRSGLQQMERELESSREPFDGLSGSTGLMRFETDRTGSLTRVDPHLVALTGLDAPERKLIITSAGQAKTFLVGERTSGARDHYVKPKASEEVVLVASKILSDLEFPEGKFMQRQDSPKRKLSLSIRPRTGGSLPWSFLAVVGISRRQQHFGLKKCVCRHNAQLIIFGHNIVPRDTGNGNMCVLAGCRTRRGLTCERSSEVAILSTHGAKGRFGEE